MNINELMAELAAGQLARAENPKLRAQIDDLIVAGNKLSDHNQELELRAKNREDQISSLLERIRNAEKDRDDALMASLEVEDKLKSFRGTVDKFSSAVASALSGIGAANATLDPPKPVQSASAAETVKEPEGNVGNASSNTQASSLQPNGQTTGSTDSSSKQEGSSPFDPSYCTNPTWPPDGSSSQGECAKDPTVQAASAEGTGFAQSTGAGDTASVSQSTTINTSNEPNPPIDTRPSYDDRPTKVPVWDDYTQMWR